MKRSVKITANPEAVVTQETEFLIEEKEMPGRGRRYNSKWRRAVNKLIPNSNKNIVLSIPAAEAFAQAVYKAGGKIARRKHETLPEMIRCWIIQACKKEGWTPEA